MFDGRLRRGGDAPARRRARRGAHRPRAIGYREVARYLAGDRTLAEARERTVVATRRFARRQDGWFRKDPRIVWVRLRRPELVDRGAWSCEQARSDRLSGRCHRSHGDDLLHRHAPSTGSSPTETTPSTWLLSRDIDQDGADGLRRLPRATVGASRWAPRRTSGSSTTTTTVGLHACPPGCSPTATFAPRRRRPLRARDDVAHVHAEMTEAAERQGPLGRRRRRPVGQFADAGLLDEVLDPVRAGHARRRRAVLPRRVRAAAPRCTAEP